MPSYSMQLYGTQTYLFTQHIQQAQESSSSISNRQGRVLALRRSQSPLGLPLGRSQSSLGAPLWNNLHIVHHLYPTMSWFEIPGFWRRNRERLLQHNGHFVFPGYAHLARRWGLRPVFVPVHPRR